MHLTLLVRELAALILELETLMMGYLRDGLGDHVSTYLSMDGSVGEAFMILIRMPYVETDDSQGATFFGYMGIAAALVFCSKFLKKWGKFLTERLVEELANNRSRRYRSNCCQD